MSNTTTTQKGTTMKPFDLEAALAGEPVVTRYGLDVTEVTYFKNVKDDYKIVALVDGRIELFTESGKLYKNEENLRDLFMKASRRTVWMNLFHWGGAYYYPSQEAADTACVRTHHERVGGRAWPLEVEE